jgi:histidinol-phosphate aminotransferase
MPRAGWQAMLDARGFGVLPSEANFLLAHCPGGEADALYRGLAARGILVRNVASGPGLAGHLRFSLGSGAALRATATALDAILGGPR